MFGTHLNTEHAEHCAGGDDQYVSEHCAGGDGQYVSLWSVVVVHDAWGVYGVIPERYTGIDGHPKAGVCWQLKELLCLLFEKQHTNNIACRDAHHAQNTQHSHT